MKIIYKYPVRVGKNRIEIDSVYAITFLNFGLDANGELCVWYLLDKDNGIHHVINLEIVGTGQALEKEIYARNYLGTTVQDIYVWHLFRI